jgi:hypothetical protein
LLAVSVVEMLARGENFDGLRASSNQGVEQAGMKALFDVDVGGNCSLHEVFLSNQTFAPEDQAVNLRFAICNLKFKIADFGFQI